MDLETRQLAAFVGKTTLRVRDILTKSFGSNNKLNLVKAALDALTQLRTKDEIARLRGVPL